MPCSRAEAAAAVPLPHQAAPPALTSALVLCHFHPPRRSNSELLEVFLIWVDTGSPLLRCAGTRGRFHLTFLEQLFVPQPGSWRVTVGIVLREHTLRCSRCPLSASLHLATMCTTQVKFSLGFYRKQMVGYFVDDTVSHR